MSNIVDNRTDMLKFEGIAVNLSLWYGMFRFIEGQLRNSNILSYSRFRISIEISF